MQCNGSCNPPCLKSPRRCSFCPRLADQPDRYFTTPGDGSRLVSCAGCFDLLMSNPAASMSAREAQIGRLAERLDYACSTLQGYESAVPFSGLPRAQREAMSAYALGSSPMERGPLLRFMFARLGESFPWCGCAAGFDEAPCAGCELPGWHKAVTSSYEIA